MADVIFPPHVLVRRSRFRYRNAVGENRMLYTGMPETTGYGADRYMLQLDVEDLGGRDADGQAELAAFIAWANAIEGKVNRSWLWDHSYKPRGALALAAPELLTNPTFEQGTAGWTDGSEMVGAVADRVWRAKRTAVTITQPILDGQFPVTQYVPYVVRCFVRGGRYPVGLRVTLRDAAGTGIIAASASSTDFGMFTAAGVPYDATAELQFEDTSFAGLVADDFVDIAYASASRCLLVDAGPNMLLQSDEFDTTWTTTNATVDDQTAATLAPDGSSNADALEENTTNGFHLVNQSATVPAAAADFCIGVAVKAGTRGFVFLRMGVADDVSVYFNLANGATSAPSVGASWANARVFSVDRGNGWRVCYLIARKTSAATTLAVAIGSATALGTGSYAGVNGDDAIYLWRATLAQSSVPTRLVQTTTSATSGTSPTAGVIHVKGGRGPSEGALEKALLMNDMAELITSRGSQPSRCRGQLDLDAAGLGTNLIAPPLRGTMLDNAPIILRQPMGRFLFAGEMPEWQNESVFTAASLSFEEAGDA